MKIGLTTYLTTFQNRGGLEVQIRKTAEGLNLLGIDARIVELTRENVADYDIIHHFSLNHASFRVLETARRAGVGTVVTPIVTADFRPQDAWRVKATTYALHRLLGPEYRTRWHNILDGLKCSDAVCTLTDTERELILKLDVADPGAIHVVPNGVSEEFFRADPTPFSNHYPNLGGSVLIASSIRPYKNQLRVIKAARRAGLHTVLAGPVVDDAYFHACMRAGGECVTYVGELDYPSPELVGAFAAAGVVVLASTREPFGLVPFEALAAGTPSILTTVSRVSRPSAPPYFQRVDPLDERALQSALDAAVQAPRAPDKCRALVEDMSWGRVCTQLSDIYRSVLG